MEMLGLEKLSKDDRKFEFNKIIEKVEKNENLLKKTLKEFDINKESKVASKLEYKMNIKNLEILLTSLDIIPIDSKQGKKIINMSKELEQKTDKLREIVDSSLTKNFVYKEVNQITHDEYNSYESCGATTYSSCG